MAHRVQERPPGPIRRLAQPTLLAQIVTIICSLVQVLILTRLLNVSDYARYGVLTALWAIGNAVLGTSIGTRVARQAVGQSGRIQFSSVDIAMMAVAGGVNVAYCFFSWGGIAVGVLAAGTTLSFVLAEARTSLELGQRNYALYMILISIKVSVPLLLIVVANSVGLSLSLPAAMVCILIGNVAACLVSVTSVWSLKILSKDTKTLEWIGIINLGLWVVSGASRVVMDGRISVQEIAIYTLAYSLVDRGFRSLQNAYISRNLANVFDGKYRQSPLVWIAFSTLLFAVSSAILPTVTLKMSAGAYGASWGLAITLSAASALMFASAPLYLKILANGRLRMAAFTSIIIACCNVAANIALVGGVGTIASATILLLSYFMWIAVLIALSGFGVRNDRLTRHAAPR